MQRSIRNPTGLGGQHDSDAKIAPSKYAADPVQLAFRSVWAPRPKARLLMSTQSTKSMLILTTLLFIAFISLGLPDGLLGVASPSIRRTFDLPVNAIGSLFVVSTIGYTLSSVISGRLMALLGVGHLLALSSLLTAGALMGYALSPMWEVMVALSFVTGLGAGAIDAGLNTYVAANRSERLMQWLHAFFGVGSTLGPIIMTTVFRLDLSWRWGYAVVSVAQFAMAIAFVASAGRWKGTTTATDERAPIPSATMWNTLKQSGALLGIAIFFVYTGLEYSIGQWSYTLFVESRAIAPERAGLWVSLYWGMFTFGRIAAGAIGPRTSSAALLRAGMAGAVAGALLLLWNPAPISGMFAVGLLGLSLAPIFPALISTTVTRVGAGHVSNTIGFQVGAAGMGVSIIPATIGVLADRFGLEVIGASLLGLTIVLAAVYVMAASVSEARIPRPRRVSRGQPG